MVSPENALRIPRGIIPIILGVPTMIPPGMPAGILPGMSAGIYPLFLDGIPPETSSILYSEISPRIHQQISAVYIISFLLSLVLMTKKNAKRAFWRCLRELIHELRKKFFQVFFFLRMLPVISIRISLGMPVGIASEIPDRIC